jgi:predicted permease
MDFLGALHRDVRVALRSFRRAPLFAATVVLTIALALGLNTTVFTIFNAYVLRPVAVRDPHSLFEVGWRDRDGHVHAFTWAQYGSLHALPIAGQSFAFQRFAARVSGQPLYGAAATGNALAVLGASTHLGRALRPDDAVPPVGAQVMVLSYDAWRSRFGGDSALVGRTVQLRGQPVTVVGVLARGFGGVSLVPPDFWVPLPLANALADAPDLFGPLEPPVLRVAVRLPPDVKAERAEAALAHWATVTTLGAPDSLHAIGATLTPLASPLPHDAATLAMFAPAIAAFALVLLIACANVTNVMLARALARQREVGIRLTLGAPRERLVRQFVTESLLLALGAAVLGYALSRWTVGSGVRLLFASMPPEFVPYARVASLDPDARVFTFLFVTTVGAALLFGLVPALQATRPSVVSASRGHFDVEGRTGRLRTALMLAQVTVCALLLVTTGVLLRGARRAHEIGTGMQTTHGVQLVLDERLRAATLDRLRHDPVVEALGGTAFTAVDGSYPVAAVQADAPTGDHRSADAAYDFVSAGYFTTLGIPLRRGRAFTPGEERDGAAVAMVSEAAARRLWPGRDPVGQVIRLPGAPTGDGALTRVRTAEVIGVVGNAVSGWLGTGLERPVVYYPADVERAGMRVIARVHGDAPRARDHLGESLDGGTGAVEELHTLDDYLAVQRYPFQLFAWVASALALVALVLTVVGLYGVLAYLVAQRTREFGIRMALGATTARVIAGVLGESFRLAAVGSALGAALAVGASAIFAHLLVLVDTFDRVGYAGGMAVVLGACALAAYVPARRASRVAPAIALRQD